MRFKYGITASVMTVLILALVFGSAAMADQEQALTYFEAGKYVEAAGEFQALLDEHPDYAYAYFMLGNCFLRINELEDAEKHLLKAIELNGDKFEYYYQLANADVKMGKSEKVIDAFEQLERNTYHYGMSTRSLFTLMAQNGPSYLHAGTNSETGLLATNKYQADVLRFPLVFIFPSGGTFWSTNPICILDADWVTEEQGEAAKLYAEYLQEPEAQETAVEIGLRPASDIELHAPIALENGTDPRVSPETIPSLESVSGDTATAIKDVFKMTKRRATVVILLDTSLSMRGVKMKNAVDGTINFIKRLERDDKVIAYTFSDNTVELEPSGRVGNVTESLRRILSGLFAEGNTALYDSICTAVERLSQEREGDQGSGVKRNYGIVLLSDGEDTNSRINESDMFMCLPSGEDVEGIKVFTIGYGDEADEDLLLRIANRTNGKAYSGDPTTIEEVYLAISFEQ